MANAPPLNLLDEAVGGGGGGRMILVEDCVETAGAFVLHHLLKRALPPNSSDVVVFLSFAHPFSHYDRVLRKMGCNLGVQRDSKRLLFFDMLTLERLDRNRGKTSEDILMALYGEVQSAVEVCLSREGRRRITVIVDDVSLMEVDANGSSNLVLDFLHYCYSLTAQFGCSLITLNHEDVYSTMDRPNLLLQLEYLADVVIKVEPLATGLATDVHGQDFKTALANRGTGFIISTSGLRKAVSNISILEARVEVIDNLIPFKLNQRKMAKACRNRTPTIKFIRVNIEDVFELPSTGSGIWMVVPDVKAIALS